jgi:hypothetical protein
VTANARCPVLVVPRSAMRRSPGVVCLVTGRRMNDVREQPVGSFAGVVFPNAPVGTFANVRRRRDQGTGTFFGDADHQRQGSFGDTDGAELEVRASVHAMRDDLDHAA